MKTYVFKFICSAVLCFAELWATAQTKSTITIKSITIENGDTIVKEKTYTSDGNSIITDSMPGNNSQFMFFNGTFPFDSNFMQGFPKFDRNYSDLFGQGFGNFQGMDDLFKRFSDSTGSFFNNHNFNFFDNETPYGFDSLQSGNNFRDYTPNDNSFGNDQTPGQGHFQAYNINCRKIVSSAAPEVENYSVEPDRETGTLKVAFNLDPDKQTSICIKDARNKSVYQEKLTKSKGLYTRLFDLTVYESGLYTHSVSQGKKCCTTQIGFWKNQ